MASGRVRRKTVDNYRNGGSESSFLVKLLGGEKIDVGCSLK